MIEVFWACAKITLNVINLEPVTSTISPAIAISKLDQHGAEAVQPCMLTVIGMIVVAVLAKRMTSMMMATRTMTTMMIVMK